MRIDDLFPMSLYEMDWYEMSPLAAVLHQNKGRWIHFSRGAPNRDIENIKFVSEPNKPSDYWDRNAVRQYKRQVATVARQNATHLVPKLGVNPKTIWKDPKGVYFYPIDWLLQGHSRIADAGQLGLDFPFYYICDINLHDPDGIDLGSVTWEEVEAIAKRNGWYDAMQAMRALPLDEQRDKMGGPFAKPQLPGGFFWGCVNAMVKASQITWEKAYKGVSFVYDPNLAIIYNLEPDQIVVRDPRVISNVQMGENKRPVKSTGRDDVQMWMHAFLAIMRRVQGKFGGTLTWMKKVPTLTFSSGQGQFTLSVATEMRGGMRAELSLNYTYGRARGYQRISSGDLLNRSMDEIVHMIGERVEQVRDRDTDLLFQPLVSIDIGKKIITEVIADRLPMDISVEISNPEDNGGFGGSAFLHGGADKMVDGVRLELGISWHVHANDMSCSVNLRGGAQTHIMSGQTMPGAKAKTLDEMFAGIGERMKQSLDNFDIGPRENAGYMSYHPRLRAEEVAPFKGWLVRNSGLSFGGEMHNWFSDDIAAYEGYPDKENLHDNIRYVLNQKWR